MDWFTLKDIFRNENLFLIYLNFKDVLNLSHVNKIFYQIFSDNMTWFNLFKQFYPQLFTIDKNNKIFIEKLTESNRKINLLKLNYYSQKIIKNKIETIYSKINNKSNKFFTLVMSNYCYFGEGYITQLISQYYSPKYDPCNPDISIKYINYLDKQYTFEVYYETTLQAEYYAVRAQQIKNCDCLMFIIDTRIQSNDMIETIVKYSEQVERAEKLMLFSIVTGFEDEDKRLEIMKALEFYKLKLQCLNSFCKFIFSICNLKLYNDTLDIANNIVKNCVENSCEINYLKLMNDILWKKKIDKRLSQNTTTKENKQGKECYLM